MFFGLRGGGAFFEFFLFAFGDAVFALGHGGDFAVELHVIFEAGGIQRAGVEGGADGAGGFVLVAAVGEFALGGEGVDVGEGVDEGVGGFAECEAAETGGVDDEAAGGGADEVAEGGAVATFVVEFAGFHHVLDVGVGECVDEGGLADAGGTEDDGGGSGGEVMADGVEGGGRFDADGVEGGVAGDGAGLVEEGLGVFAEVGFGEEDDGACAGFAGEGEVAFEAAEVEVFVEGGAEEGEVDVGGEELLVGGESADEGGFSREDAGDLRGAAVAFVGETAEENPVADGGEIGAEDGGVADFAGDFGPDGAVGGLDEVGFLVLLDDARDGGGEFVGGEEGGEVGGPAVGLEVVKVRVRHAKPLRSRGALRSRWERSVGGNRGHEWPFACKRSCIRFPTGWKGGRCRRRAS